MEKVYEEQIIRVMRRAIIERFGLIKTTLYDDVKLADIFSGCYQINPDESVPEVYAFAECFDSFVGQMRARLEHVQRMDYTERDRAFIKRQILAVQTEKDAILRKKRLAQSQIDAMLVRREVLGNTGVDEDELSRLKLDMETGDARLVLLESEEKSLLDKLSALEEYWRELEQDFEWRDKAIEWMKGLPLYEIKLYIKQTNKLFEDGSHILYVNGAYQNDENEIGKLMHGFKIQHTELQLHQRKSDENY